ncbi:MAG TPA: ABC transporter permease [Thermomicrobiales bacterium]|nr:ABC transporter permease [Thermomicrobiales bacterium]
MGHYLLRRLISLALVVFGVTVVVFLIIHIAPGDPAQIMLGAQARPEDLVTLRHELGLDQPVYVQYATWIDHAVHGDLGRSISLHRPVLNEVVSRFKNTLLLSIAAMLISFPLGIGIGVVSAVKRGALLDRLFILLATLGLSLPSFWFAMMLIIVFSVKLRWLPGAGMSSPIGPGGPLDVAKHMILPAIALSVIPLAVIARYTRSSMLEVISQEFVTTARAKGLTDYAVVIRHVFRNTLVLIVTMLGLQIGFLLAGAVYIENVFSWPGVGQLLVNAILKRDFPLVQGGVLLVALSYVVINLLTDLTYAYLDPRIRLS